MREVEVSEADDEWNQLSQVHVHVTAFCVLRVKRRKASLNRQPSAYTCMGGARFSLNTSQVIWKQTVNATLVLGHQAELAHC